MEHKVYLCGWLRSPEGFRLWTIADPRVCSEAANYALAEERLLEAIQARGGAMHAVLELDPPLPTSEEELKHRSPELYLIGGDDRFETDGPRGAMFETEAQKQARLTWVDSFFELPVCRKCAAANSPRSELALHLTHAPGRYDGAFGHVGKNASANIKIVSETFLSLLSVDERQHLIFRPVLRKGRSRKFYELLGPAGPPFVAVAGLPLTGWRCSSCGRARWSHRVDGCTIDSFVARSDLPRTLPGIFTVGGSSEVHLCATGARWRELVGKTGVRGFVSRVLGVASDRDVVRYPPLPSYEEQLARGR